ncbi:MAG TPA: GtrA family protein [Candidatus Saccharimonadales bacterium]|nr:GtrA family protein [Candidatus Saccharimonadales bacterium]
MNLHLYYQGPVYARIDRGQLVAYMVTGAVVTGADYGTFTYLFSVLSQSLLIATVGAYIVGLIVSYLLSRYWVFRKGADRQNSATNLFRYVAFLLMNLAITFLMLWAMERWFGISPYIGKFIVNFFMFFWIYLGNTYWVFAGEKIGPIKL